jgi:peptidoglycan/xylan/chitin deacetylase (PgdA/CDA1 family)
MIDRQRKIRVSEIVEGNWLQPRIAITFDDGPHPVMTSRLLAELKRLDVKATFFLVGKRMRYHPDLVTKMLLEGHEIGNHTYNHVRLPCLPSTEILATFARTDATMRMIIGGSSRLIRPPGGEYSPALSRRLAASGYVNVLWTCDPADYKPGRSASEITRLIIRDINPGGVILLHSGLQTTIDSLAGTVSALRNRGYAFTTVTEMILSGGTTRQSDRNLVSRTRVDDVADEIGAVYGDATRSEDYRRKLREYKVDFPGTLLQRLLNRTRVND